MGRQYLQVPFNSICRFTDQTPTSIKGIFFETALCAGIMLIIGKNETSGFRISAINAFPTMHPDFIKAEIDWATELAPIHIYLIKPTGEDQIANDWINILGSTYPDVINQAHITEKSHFRQNNMSVLLKKLLKQSPETDLVFESYPSYYQADIIDYSLQLRLMCHPAGWQLYKTVIDSYINYLNYLLAKKITSTPAHPDENPEIKHVRRVTNLASYLYLDIAENKATPMGAILFNGEHWCTYQRSNLLCPEDGNWNLHYKHIEWFDTVIQKKILASFEQTEFYGHIHTRATLKDWLSGIHFDSQLEAYTIASTLAHVVQIVLMQGNMQAIFKQNINEIVQFIHTQLDSLTLSPEALAFFREKSENIQNTLTRKSYEQTGLRQLSIKLNAEIKDSKRAQFFLAELKNNSEFLACYFAQLPMELQTNCRMVTYYEQHVISPNIIQKKEQAIKILIEGAKDQYRERNLARAKKLFEECLENSTEIFCGQSKELARLYYYLGSTILQIQERGFPDLKTEETSLMEKSLRYAQQNLPVSLERQKAEKRLKRISPPHPDLKVSCAAP